MKKIYRISILMVALIFASSCVQDEGGLNPPEPQTVTIKAGTGSTKTLLDEGLVKWEKGDEIAIVFTHPSDASHVASFATSIEGSASSADFAGRLPLEVTGEEGGYNENAYAVYPVSAVSDDGSVDFTLPSEQKVRTDGAIAAGLNLSSAKVSLADIREDGNASASFLNALSILRFALGDDVTSVTLTGTAPLAGRAPFVIDFEQEGRLVIDGSASWSDSDKEVSVTLKPADGAECFADGEEVNLLVLPGTHTSLSVKLTTTGERNFEKTSDQAVTFVASKYYTLNFNIESDVLVEELTFLEGELSGLEDRLSRLETNAEKIAMLLDQIQSVALMTEYLDNSVYAYYANTMYSTVNRPITIDYLVRPVKAMELLLDICAEEGNLSDVLSAKIDYRTGYLHDLGIRDAILDGDVLTVNVDADQIEKSFYDGNIPASVALEISDGNTEILSDFANLVPQKKLLLNVANTSNIPAMKGAAINITFQFGALDASKVAANIKDVNGFSTTPTVRLTPSANKGFISAYFKDTDDPSSMSFSIVVTDGNDTDSVNLTFMDGGEFEIPSDLTIDYVGGELFITPVEPHNYGNVKMELKNDGWSKVYFEKTEKIDEKSYWYSWIEETTTGIGGAYTVKPNVQEFVTAENPAYKFYNSNTQKWEIDNDQPETLTFEVNSGAERTSKVEVTISSLDNKYTYNKSVSIRQKESGSSIDQSLYYQDGTVVQLSEATASGITPLNLVILGDGYQKKDLMKNGKFHSRAVSAVGSFFGVEPFKSFQDRFNVFMVAYESVDEGIDIQSQSVDKDTYYETYWNGSTTAAYLTSNGVSKVNNIVKGTLGLDTDAEYYRTIVLILSNTDAVAGSCGYPYRDVYSNVSTVGESYASFAIAVLPANSTGTNGLIKHELGGHGFGRLGDEYETQSYSDSDLNTWHTKGFYRNVTTNKSAWNWDSFSSYSGYTVEYIWRNNNYWCPSEGGIMYNNQGVFNAPSRQIIYERIIRQTEGADAYSFEKFIEYDKKNL